MQKTLREIAEIVGGEIVGDAGTIITGVSGIKEAVKGDLTFLANPKYAPQLETTLASAIITSKEINKSAKPIIRVDNPSLAFTRVVSALFPDNLRHPEGIDKAAIVSVKAKLGKNVSIGPYAVICDNASIGDNAIIYPGCFIGEGVKMGSDCLIYSNVTLREKVVIGKRVIIHSSTVVGSDGFGYITVEHKHIKIPQIGTVEIQDDVEIGANVAIDRARFDKTIIGKGTKIDNLVHIAHNVVTGENCLIVAQAGVSGSTHLGKNVILAGQAGLVGHITIGDNAICAAQAGVTKSVPADTMVSGYPAKPHEIAKRVNACVQNLPKLYEMVKQLKKKIEELESKGKPK